MTKRCVPPSTKGSLLLVVAIVTITFELGLNFQAFEPLYHFINIFIVKLLAKVKLKSLPYNHTANSVMVLTLPCLKDINNFVLKLIFSLLIFKCLRGVLYSSMIHHWNCQLKPYFSILVLWHWFCPDLKKSPILFSSLYVLYSFLSALEVTYIQVRYIIGIISSSPTDFQSEKIGLIRVTNYLLCQ